MKIDLPENINPENPEKYTLFLRTGQDEISFLIQDKEKSFFFYHQIQSSDTEDILQNFKEFFYENEFLAAGFDRIFIINHSPHFTFIPSHVYEEIYKADFFKFNLPDEKSEMLTENLSSLSITLLHGIREELYEFLLRSFFKPVFIHYFSPILSFFHEKVKIGNNSKLLVNIENRNIDIFHFSPEGNLEFANNFYYTHRNDALYYILFVWKQFQLNQLKDQLYLTGNSTESSFIHAYLKKYIDRIVLFEKEKYTVYPDLKQNIPFDLYILLTCEL